MHSAYSFFGFRNYSVDEIQHPIGVANKNGASKEKCIWGTYARGALYALQTSKKNLKQVMGLNLVFLLEL